MSEPSDVRFSYVRQGSRLTVALVNLAATELSELIVGLWARFQPDGRRAMIAELGEYADALEAPSGQTTDLLSPMAQLVGSAPAGVTVFDLPAPPKF